MIDIFNKLFNKPAVWDVAVAINRSNSMPLDKNSIFPNYALAEAYATGNAVKINNALVDLAVLEESKRLVEGAEGAADTAAANLASVMFNNNAYPGQVLAVVTETETSVYYIDAQGKLQEVGGKISSEQIKNLGFSTTEEMNTAIAKAVAEAGHATALIVDSVNTTNGTYTIGEETKNAEANVIYYVFVESAKGDDKYNEYMLIGTKLVLIGSTSTDLTNYYNKDEVDALVKDFITINDIPSVTVKQDGVEIPTLEDGSKELVVLTGITAEGHEITPAYSKAATAEYVDEAISAIVFPTVEVVKDKDAELEENQTSISVLATIENPSDDGATHTLKYQTVELPTIARVDAVEAKVDAIVIPEIPNISITDDTSVSDVNITITEGEGEEATEREVLGLVTVLRDMTVDEENGHILKEARIAVPTLAYIEKMISDVTGGESAGEVLAQLNNFKTEVGNTYLKKTDYEDTNTTYALSCLTGAENSNSVSIALTGSDNTTKSVVLKSVDENDNPTAIKVTKTADGAINITLAWEEMENLA
jgi:hypothetical protein